ncbi:hypothetical protein A7E78_08535 [Syntrophotalea acetylenivorans]|uniref:Murein endopeptidase K n=1 Tax=Syntrophotalea acetylenivorans TaxID=1842532 RepID=A0A1L3GPL0_9BACT|nr:DUF882 domain-containing protein [Syntrophotalea acetylenivorans]APG27876.1 hypothetical protein A7E78_08535 [Syntrophotalea acetylenivorans]
MLTTDSQCSTSKGSTFNRRTLLKAGLIGLAGLALPTPGLALLTGPADRERSLSLYNTHTGEGLKSVVYWADGDYLPEALKDINFLLRDHRTDQVKPMDPKLFDQLYTLNTKLENRKPFQIISGYRSPESNRKLRQASSGVAKKSFHLAGQAADIRLPGCNLSQVRRAALNLRAGGVGYYPKSNFIHVDTGPCRSW